MNDHTAHDPAVAIEQALARLAGCPGFDGVVLATADGLVLACAGSLNGDAAAACAATLSVDMRKALETVDRPGPVEMMLWSGQQVWYQAELPSSQLLLAVSRDPAHAGALRLAVRREFEPLSLALGTLSTPAHTG